MEHTNMDMDQKEVSEKANMIYNRVNEINKLKTKHPVIFDYFTYEIKNDYCNTKLNRIWVHICDETTRSSRQLLNKIKVAKSLSLLDDLINGSKFRDLYLQYQEKIYNTGKIDPKPVKDAVDAKNYFEVASEMSKLSQDKEDDINAKAAFETIKKLPCHLFKTVSSKRL